MTLYSYRREGGRVRERERSYGFRPQGGREGAGLVVGEGEFVTSICLARRKNQLPVCVGSEKEKGSVRRSCMTVLTGYDVAGRKKNHCDSQLYLHTCMYMLMLIPVANQRTSLAMGGCLNLQTALSMPTCCSPCRLTQGLSSTSSSRLAAASLFEYRSSM